MLGLKKALLSYTRIGLTLPTSGGGFTPSLPEVGDPPPPAQARVHFLQSPTRLEYSVDDGATWDEAAGIAMRVPDTNRVVHTVDLTGLPVDSDVSVRLPSGDVAAFYTTYAGDPTTTLVVHWHTLQPIFGDYHTRPINTAAVRTSFTQPGTLGVNEDWRLASLSDTHGGSDAVAVAQAVAARNPRLVIHSGDVATGDGGTSSPATWYVQFDAITALVDSQNRHIPFIPNIGNHEMPNSLSGVEWQTSLREGGVFGPPKPDFENDVRAGAEWYYSFFPRFPGLQGFNVLDVGNYLSVLVIDVITSRFRGEDGGPNQQEWITTTLAARQAVPHKVATMHYSPYPGGRRPMLRTYLDTRRYLCSRLYAGNCCLVFAGHDHTAYKSVPLSQFDFLDHQTNYPPTPGGMIIVGSGPGGAAGRNGRNADGKWFIDKNRPLEIEFYAFEASVPSRPERFEPRFPPGPRPTDGQVFANADVVNFWEMDLSATTRTVRSWTLNGEMWEEFTQGADPT